MPYNNTSRSYVVTGAASGIGRVTAELLINHGHRVLGVDLHGSDLDADLTTTAGRDAIAPAAREAFGDALDGVIAVAGLATPTSMAVSVNYFGAIATLETLQPMLARAAQPRAAVVASFSALQDIDEKLLDLLRQCAEKDAVRHADTLVAGTRGNLIYASTKRAIAEWVRQESITEAWAGAGIPLNAVAPGIILTPMTEDLLKTPEGRDTLMATVPMPLHGPAEPEVIARALEWLTSAENSHMAGQIVFLDGGADVSIRGPRVFG